MAGPARFLLAAGDRAFEGGRLEEARRHYEKALSTARATNDATEELLAQNQLGVLAERRGALEDARDHYLAALQLQQVTGDPVVEAMVLGNLASVERLRGDREAARRAAHRALDLAPPDRDPAGAATGWRQLGRIARDEGRRTEAKSAWRSSATLFERARMPELAAEVRLELAALLLVDGDTRDAVAEYSSAAGTFRGLATRPRGRARLVDALGGLADAYDALGQPRNAVTFRERALDEARPLADDALNARLLDAACASAAAAGRADLAARWRAEREELRARR